MNRTDKKKKTTTNLFERYIIAMDAFYPKTYIEGGKKFVQGEYAGGFVTVGKIQNPLKKGIVLTEADAREAANFWWKTKYVGHMKQLWIKEEGEMIAFHSNFSHKKIRGGHFGKIFSK